MKYKKGSFIVIPNQITLKGLDPKAQCLFMWLCFHANQEGECFPSRKLLSSETGMSVDSVKRMVKLLEKSKLVEFKNRKKGKENLTNLYQIKIEVVGADSTEGVGADRTPLGADSTEGVGADSTSELNPSSLTQSTKLCNASVAGKEVNDFIELFEPINPTFEKIFANKTQRGAVERLLKKFGFKKMAGTLTAVQISNRQKFAPKITTPLELENNLGKLVAFFQSNPKLFSNQPKNRKA